MVGMKTVWLGTVPYREALSLQLEKHWQVATGEAPPTLLLLEHPPVYTFGKRGGHHLLRRDPSALRELGADLVQTDRGGLVTFHGPGQLVGYPILPLAAMGLDLTRYVELLLAGLRDTLRQLGLAAEADLERPGIYVEGRKIGAVGVRLREKVTYHGFALNLSVDLSWFDHIVACGLTDVSVTSMERELARPVTVEEVRPVLSESLAATLGLETAAE
jgi:lipoyl(octanoyl) transferase